MITSEISAVSRVREVTEEVFAAIREVRDVTAACLGSARPVAADLAVLRPLLWSRLTDGPVAALIAGIGFIAAPGLLADAPWYLEWWQEHPSGQPKQLLRDLDPASSAFYDYTHWEWFTGPRSGAERTICGPYVDYLCTDEYSLTLSVPVTVGGAFAGAAAADVFVRKFEAAVAPALRELPAPAFLVNGEGRVVASNSARWLSGSVYRGGLAETAIPGLRLSLVQGPAAE